MDATGSAFFEFKEPQPGEPKRELLSRVLLFLKGVCNVWPDASEDKCEIVAVATAMSNQVFQLTRENCDRLIFRIYGDSSGGLIDRKKEVLIARAVSKMPGAIAILATFANGRVEAFCTGVEVSPRCIRLPEISTKIAEKMARVHSWSLNTEPILSSSVTLAERIENWLALLRGKERSEEIRSLSEVAGNFWNKVKGEVFEENVVLCHCDLQCGNLLYCEDEDKVTFIDFEYACLAPFYFDIANHWCEWAADYDAPVAANLLRFGTHLPNSDERREFLLRYCRQRMIGVHPSFIGRCEMFVFVSHLFWGIWGLLMECQVRKPNPKFDYFAYAKSRLSETASYGSGYFSQPSD